MNHSANLQFKEDKSILIVKFLQVRIYEEHNTHKFKYNQIENTKQN